MGLVWMAFLAGISLAGSLADLIYSFPVPASGPLGELVQAADGSFYGTTSAGGASGAGTVFKITPAGAFQTVAEFSGFTGNERGAQPSSRLTLGSDGNYYGVNAQGGPDGLGTIFRVVPGGACVSIAAFTGTKGNVLGSQPFASLLAGGDGFLYGTTSKGGLNNFGTLFKIAETTGAFTTLVDFTGKTGTAKGANSYAALIKGTDGNLYGVTAKGGKTDHGTLFSLSPAGALTTLVEFTDQGAKNKGAAPYAALTQAPDGTFYGTTARGGAGDYGTVFQVTSTGTLKTLAEFTGRAGKNRGAQPESQLVFGPDGSLYGTTLNGGKYNVGTTFKVALDGKITTLVEFTNAGTQNRGAYPQAGLVLGQDNLFYGTTLRGGAGDAGTVFRMKSTGELGTLLELNGVDPVTYSQAGIIRAQDNNFYGVTAATGLLGKGSLFRISPSGVAQTLVEFTGNGAANAGSTPEAPLLQAQDGSFYGVTSHGGAYDLGTIFKITPSGTLTTLVEFTGDGAVDKGSIPRAALIQTGPDDFYGVTSAGGADDAGTVFHLAADGTLTTLVEFTDNGPANKGAAPVAPLVLGSNGKLYGTTAKGGARAYGTVFSLTTAGVLTTEAEFADDPNGIKGAYPEGSLIQASDGNFYGATSTGGATGDGTLFRLNPSGVLTTLIEFTGRGGKNRGTGPTGALLQATDGYLYGTTGFGGTANYGTVFRLNLNGQLSTLADLNYLNGAYPKNGFIVGSDGNLYTTTALGGASGAGAVLRLRLRAEADVIESAAITPFAAQLRARLKQGALAATVYFEYGTDSYDQRTPDQTITSGSDAAFLTANLTGLQPNMVYFFRLVVVDSSGTTYGHDESLTTGPAVSEVLSLGGEVDGEPNTTTITKLGIPSIADNQAVAVVAGLKTAAGNDSAILAGNPPVVIVRKGSDAPVSVPGQTATFTAFDDPACDAAGNIAFTARISLAGKPASGLWTNAGGSLVEVARIGGLAPTLAGTKLTALSSYAMSRDGVVFFTGSFSGSGVTLGDNSGLWAFDENGSHLLLRKGDLVGGVKITAIAALGPVTGSTGQGRGYSGHTVTARVTLGKTGQAILQLTPGANPVLLGPTPFGLSSDPFASIVASVGFPSVSSSGATAFTASLQGEKPAIVTSSPTPALVKLAQVGSAAPGVEPAVFATLSEPVINGQAQAAFLANLAGPGVTKATQGSLWWKSNTGLSLLAQAGSPVPTIAAAKWSAFTSVVLPENARPVFLAKLAAASVDRGLPSDVKPTTNVGLFGVDANRVRRLLVRTGDVVQLPGGTKQISVITIFGAVAGSPGQGRHYNTTGDLVFRATFTDHSQAILRVPLP